MRGDMAQKAVSLDEETFNCSICLELLRDPVTIPCGHNYCFSCIERHWDGVGNGGIHQCPQCRENFIPRPELKKNTMLAALVDELKKAGLQSAPADICYAGAEDVACDFCTGRKLKALKSCLVCQVSYCDTHLQPHFQSPAFAKHKLVDASKSLQEMICSQHDKLIDMFCRTDQKCICYFCSMDEHKGHNIVSAEAERRERHEQLQESWKAIQRRIQDREEDIRVLQQEVKAIDCSADEAVEHSQKIFRELISLVEKRSCEVKKQIISQQKAEVIRVNELRKKLEQEITDLRSKDAELRQLLDTKDHGSFLRKYPSVSQLGRDSSRIRIHPHGSFEKIKAALSESSKKLQGLLKDMWTSISPPQMDGLMSQPKTRAEILRYSCDITLDVNTANAQLLISVGNRRATMTWDKNSYPHHPDRFLNRCQVLSREGLTGRHYWEVEVRGRRAQVAVAYKDISRVGDESRFGHNDKSWCLDCDSEGYTFWCNGVPSTLSGPWSSTVGVYLDHPAGTVSFYSVSDTMTLLHRVQTAFTQPLHAGLRLCYVNAPAEFLKVQ